MPLYCKAYSIIQTVCIMKMMLFYVGKLAQRQRMRKYQAATIASVTECERKTEMGNREKREN